MINMDGWGEAVQGQFSKKYSNKVSGMVRFDSINGWTG